MSNLCSRQHRSRSFEDNFGVKALIHRDRDFMTDTECKKWSDLYTAADRAVWITDHVDVEAYFCQPDYLMKLYNADEPTAREWIRQAVDATTKTRDKFFEKRKKTNYHLWVDGGGESSEDLWVKWGEKSDQTVLGKSLLKSLKNIVKTNGANEKLLDRFVVPDGYEVAPTLKSVIEKLLN